MRSRLIPLLAALFLAALPPACNAQATAAAKAGPAEIRFDQFYAGGRTQGPEFSPLARSLAGKRVRISGYVAPPFRADAEFFILTRVAMHVCPYCNPDENWPIDLVVAYTSGALPESDHDATISVVGTLEIGPKLDTVTGMVSQLRLIDAVVDTARH